METKNNRRNRPVERLLYARMVDMGGIPVRQPLPTMKVDQIDPFLLLHHAHAKIAADRDPKTSGVGPHPHRGFSPVTFVFKGGVHHRDSRGNSSVVTAGGTQWMNAGMGIIHSERPPANIQELGGEQEIIQLWINTPQKHKMDQPAYYPLSAEDTPSVDTDDHKVQIKIVAGRYGSVKGPIPTVSEIMAIRTEFRQGGSHFFDIPVDYNAFIYVLSGKLKLEGYGYVDALNLVKFNMEGIGIGVKALEDSRFILMAGVPLNEPVESQGPFVMNTTTEIMEAMRDYQMGKMGVLIEDDLI